MNWRIALVAVSIAALAVGSVPTTYAVFTKSVSMQGASVQAIAGTVNPPTGLTASQVAGGVKLTWTAPATGLTPDSYDAFRRTEPAGYGGTPSGTSATTSWLDTSQHDNPPATCPTYDYHVRSRRGGLTSSFSNEVAITPDFTKPVVVSAHIYGINATTGGQVADYVKPGGYFYLYANVTDNCDSANAVTVSANLAGLITVPLTSGSYTTPDGKTWNYRYSSQDAAVKVPAYPDGQAAPVTMSATDSHGNTATTPGTTVVIDAAGPVLDRAQVISFDSQFYGTQPGQAGPIGEIMNGAPYQAYANFSDPESGISSDDDAVTIDASVLNDAATADDMATSGGPFTTANGVVWDRQSPKRRNDNLTVDGQYHVTMTAVDLLGNTSTVSVPFLIDNVGPVPTSCTIGNGNGKIDNGDTITVTYDDVLWPDSLNPNGPWTGSLSVPAIVTQGRAHGNTDDFLAVSRDDANFMRNGGNVNNSFDLADSDWVTSDKAFSNSVISLVGETGIRLTLGGGGAAIPQPQAGLVGQISLSQKIKNAAGVRNVSNPTVDCNLTF